MRSEFTDKGICKFAKTGGWEICCCEVCYMMVGHFRILPKDDKLLDIYAKNFDEGYGFWLRANS